MVAMNEFAKALNQYRLKEKLTFRDLERKTGVSRSTFHGIIKRGQCPNDLTRQRIIETLPKLATMCHERI